MGLETFDETSSSRASFEMRKIWIIWEMTFEMSSNGGKPTRRILTDETICDHVCLTFSSFFSNKRKPHAHAWQQQLDVMPVDHRHRCESRSMILRSTGGYLC